MFKRNRLSVLTVLALTPGSAIAQPAPEAIQPPPPPAVTTVLPAEVGGLFLINTSPEAWNRLKRFIALPPGLSGPGFLPYIPSGVNFATDIQPWLGDWTAIALMPRQSSAPNVNLDRNAVMVAPIKEGSRMDNFVSQVTASLGKSPIERQYQGVTLLEWSGEVVGQNSVSPTVGLQQSAPQSAIAQPGGFKLPFSAPIAKFQLTKALPLLAQTRPTLPPLPTSPSQPTETVPPAPRQQVPQPTPKSESGLAIAIVPGYIAAANSAAPIEQWIDSQSSGSTLARDPEFRRTLEKPEFGRSLFVGYGNLPQLAKLSRNTQLPSFPVPLPIATAVGVTSLDSAIESFAQTYNALDLFVWVEPQGIRSQGRAFYKTPQPENATSPTVNEMPSRLPGATYIAAIGRNLNQLWQSISQGSAKQPQTSTGLVAFRQFARENLKLDLDREVFPWMDGEYAAFVFPTNQGFFPSFDQRLKLGVGLIVQTSDRPAAERVLAQLDESVQTLSDGLLTINRQTLKKQPVTSWDVQNPATGIKQSLFAHGWIGDNTLILTTGIGPMEELNPEPYQTLDRAFTFQSAIQPLPSPNDAYFYTNIGSLLSLINNFLPPEINNSSEAGVVKNVLGSIRSLTLTTLSTPTTEQSDFLLVLSPLR